MVPVQRGRPKLELHQEEVEYLRSLRFSWTKIAEILGSSRSTLYRKMEEWNLPADIRYSQSDSELDRRVQQIKATNPNCGEVMLAAGLTAQNIHVQRARLRASIHRVDPSSTQLRRREIIRRRVYSVDGPNN